MDGLNHINPGAAGRSGLARSLARAVLGGASVALVGRGTAEVLASAGRLLGAGSAQVVRVHPPLELPEFLEQVASVSPVLGQSALERAYEILTMAGPGCDRVVLLVEEAHALPHPTLHYIEMAMQAGPKLQVALAGQPELLDKLALDGFAQLRRRLVQMDLPPEPSMAAVQEPSRPAAAPRAGRSWRLDTVAGALGLGAATLAVLLYAYSLPAVPLDAAAVAEAPQPAPEPPRILAEVDIIVVPPAAVSERPAAPVEAAAALVPAAEAPAPLAEAPEAELPTPPAIPAVAEPVRPAPRPAPVRAERAASVPSTLTQNDRRCRDIVLRAQLGDTPDNADQTFLRNGCR